MRDCQYAIEAAYAVFDARMKVLPMRASTQACGSRFPLTLRSSASPQGSNRLPIGITIAEHPVRWLSCVRGGLIGVKYRVMLRNEHRINVICH